VSIEAFGLSRYICYVMLCGWCYVKYRISTKRSWSVYYL